MWRPEMFKSDLMKGVAITLGVILALTLASIVLGFLHFGRDA